ncbi:hypothetical protein AX774_g3048 [Zancudomyces culisetae]|uniref:Myb-like domain-containing protein n=1 Tax=Zancudomyces culisetae TaxID=1213189 RepID=A0A1R1PRE1_ZANCU|nr:hypothetical protein AX774_g3048 [Zancudomyces culisetae]|eukprot:OMH83462.1 hypothetical protein AX774_g3048 [Zancudomyces culisetae]
MLSWDGVGRNNQDYGSDARDMDSRDISELGIEDNAAFDFDMNLSSDIFGLEEQNWTKFFGDNNKLLEEMKGKSKKDMIMSDSFLDNGDFSGINLLEPGVGLSKAGRGNTKNEKVEKPNKSGKKGKNKEKTKVYLGSDVTDMRLPENWRYPNIDFLQDGYQWNENNTGETSGGGGSLGSRDKSNEGTRMGQSVKKWTKEENERIMVEIKDLIRRGYSVSDTGKDGGKIIGDQEWEYIAKRMGELGNVRTAAQCKRRWKLLYQKLGARLVEGSDSGMASASAAVSVSSSGPAPSTGSKLGTGFDLGLEFGLGSGPKAKKVEEKSGFKTPKRTRLIVNSKAETTKNVNRDKRLVDLGSLGGPMTVDRKKQRAVSEATVKPVESNSCTLFQRIQGLESSEVGGSVDYSIGRDILKGDPSSQNKEIGWDILDKLESSERFKSRFYCQLLSDVVDAMGDQFSKAGMAVKRNKWRREMQLEKTLKHREPTDQDSELEAKGNESFGENRREPICNKLDFNALVELAGQPAQNTFSDLPKDTNDDTQYHEFLRSLSQATSHMMTPKDAAVLNLNDLSSNTKTNTGKQQVEEEEDDDYVDVNIEGGSESNSDAEDRGNNTDSDNNNGENVSEVKDLIKDSGLELGEEFNLFSSILDGNLGTTKMDQLSGAEVQEWLENAGLAHISPIKAIVDVENTVNKLERKAGVESTPDVTEGQQKGESDWEELKKSVLGNLHIPEDQRRAIINSIDNSILLTKGVDSKAVSAGHLKRSAEHNLNFKSPKNAKLSHDFGKLSAGLEMESLFQEALQAGEEIDLQKQPFMPDDKPFLMDSGQMDQLRKQMMDNFQLVCQAYLIESLQNSPHSTVALHWRAQLMDIYNMYLYSDSKFGKRPFDDPDKHYVSFMSCPGAALLVPFVLYLVADLHCTFQLNSSDDSSRASSFSFPLSKQMSKQTDKNRSKSLVPVPIAPLPSNSNPNPNHNPNTNTNHHSIPNPNSNPNLTPNSNSNHISSSSSFALSQPLIPSLAYSSQSQYSSTNNTAVPNVIPDELAYNSDYLLTCTLVQRASKGPKCSCVKQHIPSHPYMLQYVFPAIFQQNLDRLGANISDYSAYLSPDSDPICKLIATQIEEFANTVRKAHLMRRKTANTTSNSIDQFFENIEPIAPSPQSSSLLLTNVSLQPNILPSFLLTLWVPIIQTIGWDLSLYPVIQLSRRYKNRVNFLPKEDKLILRALKLFGFDDTVSMCGQLMPCKTPNQLSNRIQNLRARRAPANPVKQFYLQRVVPFNLVQEDVIKAGVMIYGKDFKNFSLEFLASWPRSVIKRVWSTIFESNS